MPFVKHHLIEAALLIVLVVSLVYVIRLDGSIKDLESNYNEVKAECNELQSSLNDYVVSKQRLQREFNDKMNINVRVYKKMWAVLAENLTLKHRDTLTINLYVVSGQDHWGVDGIDRIEIRFVNIYSPDLQGISVGTGVINQYFDGRKFGEWRVAFPSKSIRHEVPMPISLNETKVREYPSSVSFFYENWNYIGVEKWMKIELHFTSDKVFGKYPRINIEELELYMVGFEDGKVYMLENIDSAWISYRVEYYIRPYEAT